MQINDARPQYRAVVRDFGVKRMTGIRDMRLLYYSASGFKLIFTHMPSFVNGPDDSVPPSL